MHVRILSKRDFEEAWDSAPGSRFGYELNRPIMGLYAVLVAGFWAYWTASGAFKGFDLVRLSLGAVFFCVTVFAAANVVVWRRFARVSAAVCTRERLIWRHGEQSFAVDWEHVDVEALLGSYDPVRARYEHFLTIGGKRLYLYRPHVRMRNLEHFIGHLVKAQQRRNQKGKGKPEGVG